MSISDELLSRSEGKCELCGSESNLRVYEVSPSDGSADKSIVICGECASSIDNPESNPNHWHCLNESMWSPVPAVQVTAYRILSKIAHEGWPQDMLDILYLEPEVEAWAKEGLSSGDENREPTRDSNGTILEEGDSVTIIKDLEVKGAGFTAKRGTVVKNIHLTDKPTEIEGRVNGVRIVLLSKFLKKA